MDVQNPNETPRSESEARGQRDFADFLSGSHQLDPETQLPIPEDHGESSHSGSSPIDEHLKPELRDRAEVIGTAGRWFAGWCLRFIIIGAALYVAAQAFGKLWAGILPVCLSLIVCTVLWPIVRTLRGWKVPNSLAVLITILGFFAAIVGIFALIVPSAVDQGKTLVGQASDGVEKIKDWMQGPPLNLQESQYNDALNQATNWLQERSGDIASNLATWGTETLSILVTMFVMLVLTFFFLKDGENFLPLVRRVTGRRVGWHLTEVLTRCWDTLGGFIRTQAIVSMIDAVFIGLGLVLLDVPLAGALAVLTFFGGFIPMVGAFVAGALSVLIALVAVDFNAALLALLLVVAVQQLEGNILQPVLQSRAMNVHPVVILLSVTIGSTLFGIVGAFLAVPTAAMITVILRYLGDMTDLATGEKTSKDITFRTTAGSLTGKQSERAAQRWQQRRHQALRRHHTQSADSVQADAAGSPHASTSTQIAADASGTAGHNNAANGDGAGVTEHGGGALSHADATPAHAGATPSAENSVMGRMKRILGSIRGGNGQ